MIITGIGSRNTPAVILAEMTKVGAWCKLNNITLRSGHADGADVAFEKGAQELCIAYLPWEGFRPLTGYGDDPSRRPSYISDAKLVVPPWSIEAESYTTKFHPAPYALTQGARKLMNRNAHQVLGDDLKSPASAVVCWTSDWKTPSGGTSQAIRIAQSFDIPIINMNNPDFNNCDKVVAELRKILCLDKPECNCSKCKKKKV